MSPNTAAPLFIVLEGLDGCGKSTLAHALAERLDAHLLSTPLSELKSVRAVVDAVLDPAPLARALWYAAQVVRASELVRALRKQGKAVVMDRYWLTTLAYARRTGTTLSLPEVACFLERPDQMIFLDLPHEERIRRLQLRTSSDCIALQPHDYLGVSAEGEALLRDSFYQAAEQAALGPLTSLSLADASREESLERVLSLVYASA